MAPPSLPIRKRVALSNGHFPMPQGKDFSEPGVEVLVDPLEPVPAFGTIINKVTIATHPSMPTTNEGSIRLDTAPGAGVVLPGGVNIYYLDLAPNSQTPMHRTSSTDYVIVQEGELTILAPSSPFVVEEGKGTYEVTETVCRTGDVVMQRGAMHAWANRTENWVRLVCFVLAASPARIEAGGEGKSKQLDELWLQ